MKIKSIVVSVALLAAISVVVFLVNRPAKPAAPDARVGQSLVDRTVVEKAGKLQVSDQGKSVTLTRQADGTWRDTSYYDLPADFSKLTGFIGNLTDAKIQRFVTSNPERLARLEFKDTKIALDDSSGKPLWSVTLGKAAELGGGRFLRFDDEKKAYLADINAWIDTDAKSWADAQLLNVKPDDVAKIVVEFPAVEASATAPRTPAVPATTLTFSRAKKDAAWTSDKTPANDQVKADKVASLLNEVGTVRFSDTSDLTDPNVAAAKAHERTFTLTTFDGKTYTVALGRKPEEKKLKPAAPKVEAKSAEADKNGKPAEKKAAETKPATPEYETIPAGPVYAFITASDKSAPVNALMQKRAFQVSEYTFTELPQKSADFFEPVPAPAKPETKAADDEKKSGAANTTPSSTPTAHLAPAAPAKK